MREIKFRGKRKDNGEWVYGFVEFHLVDGNLAQTKQDAFITYDSMDETGKVYRHRYEVDPVTVGEYTGLNDKNGVEIYEGDIVHCWGGEHCQGYWEHDEEITIKNMINDCFIMGEYEFIEVIGNIYSNPELLLTNEC